MRSRTTNQGTAMAEATLCEAPSWRRSSTSSGSTPRRTPATPCSSTLTNLSMTVHCHRLTRAFNAANFWAKHIALQWFSA